eukprot:TRINITY_DN62796_c0_g3_i1.p1 TRINITY_DN62796_c0_g3~~TRINITY_DN62796_c0_g3_i1.p1  ORF type:complete len:334 (-),score=52.40 TRINITY_DN62796_c0_g3_i1:26-1027(-)
MSLQELIQEQQRMIQEGTKKYNEYKQSHSPRRATQWILVTGANKGIGNAIVRRLLREYPAYSVLLGARDTTRGTEAVNQILADNPSCKDRLGFLLIDPSSDESVAAARAEVESKYGSGSPLWCIINNAGAYSKVPTPEGLKEILNINLYGPQRVNEAFNSLLDPAGRIVNISSASGPMFLAKCSSERQRQFMNHSATWKDVTDLANECVELYAASDPNEAMKEAGLGSADSYGLSKALLNLYTIFVHARDDTKRLINAVTPGFIETDLTSVFQSNGKTLAQMGAKSPDDGAKPCVQLAVGRLTSTAKYFGSDGLVSPLHKYRGPGDPEYTEVY